VKNGNRQQGPGLHAPIKEPRQLEHHVLQFRRELVEVFFQALKRLGERTYTEFKLGKTKAPQRVGDITLMLRKTDPKKNKYTVDVMADDKLTEKKDKNINEPIQFYSSKARQPYEIVVNQVQKDLIVGYLSTPKEQSSR